jgi:N-glycosidase YbiA
MAVRFYRVSDEYGVFSNFSPHGVELNGAWWPTVEHYFQARKFHDENHREEIRRAETPMQAKKLGQSREVPLRVDWEEIKDEVMFEACLAKFRTHEEAKNLLLSTGDEEIVEDSPNDYYWGCGKDGTGKNMLGKVLMRVRAEIRTQPFFLKPET